MLLSSLDKLVIRPARAEDRAAVFAFTATVWGGEDYVRHVWDDWLAATNGPLLVGTIDDQPIALAKLSDLSVGEGWIHGVRVAEELRGQGIGRAMVQHCVALSRQRGDRTLRLMTGTENLAMQRAAELLGFRAVVTADWFKQPTAPASTALLPLDEQQFARLYAELAAEPPGLYCVGWRYRELHAERLQAHLRAGEVLALPDSPAWAIVIPDEETWIGYAYGPSDALVELLQAIPNHPAGQAGSDVRALVPPDSALAQALLQAGYVQDRDGERCYELDL